MDAEQKRLYDKIYRQKPEVKERNKNNHKIWVQKNREKVNSIMRKSYHKNKDKNREKVNIRRRSAYAKLTIKQKQLRNEYRKRINILNRMKLIELLGDKCKNCGINDFNVLHLGHKNDDGNIDRERFKTRSGSNNTVKMVNYYLDNLNEAKKKLIVQCANCNQRQRMKSIYNKVKKHG